MSITTSAFRFALTAAALCAAGSIADAKPRRLVILDFDGPRQLADTGRSSVLSVLGEQYDVVATKRWDQARQAAAQVAHGPAQWSRAAKQSGVDAVIEGWVQDEGRRKVLNVIVREASNGREFDTISVRLDGKNGVSAEAQRQLQTSLDEVLDWIDPGQNEPSSTLPPVIIKRIGTQKPAADDGDSAGRKPARRVIDDEASDPQPAPAARRGKRVVAEVDTSGDAPVAPASRPARAAAPAPADGATDAPAAPPAAPPAKAPEVAVADDVHDLEILFPQRSEEQERLNPRKNHVPEKTVKYMIDAGPYIGTRSLTWDGPADANIQNFAGVSSKGIAVNAAIYPFPNKEIDGITSGLGFTASLHHSLGSSVISDEGDTINEYVINQNGWEVGAHYRMPIGSMVAVDGGAFYGTQTYEIVDASANFETPDTKYSYLGLSAHLDLAITDRATIGFGARYFTVLDSGDLQSTEFYGPASASGLGLEASFLIPLPERLYVRGQLSYQKISLELSGGGVITDQEALTGGTDSIINANVNIGIGF